MKGIAHFSMGVAIASCVPAAVRSALDGNGWPLVLGGIAGILPDTLDFRISRYLAAHDVEIVPDPLRPDASMIAQGVAWAIDRCAARRRGIRLRLRSIRMASDRWQSYAVRFDPAARKVIVEYGPVVDPGGGIVCGCPPEAGGLRLRAEAKVRADLRIEYEAEISVAGFDGPLLYLEQMKDGRISVGFLPWHRRWSHSLFLAASAGIASWLAWGTEAGVAAGCAWAAHALADHCGYMGSNLLFPLTARREEGLKMMHSSDFFPNMAAVWVSLTVIFLNLGLYSRPCPFACGMAYWRALFVGCIVPLAVIRYLLGRANRGIRVEESGVRKKTKRRN